MKTIQINNSTVFLSLSSLQKIRGDFDMMRLDSKRLNTIAYKGISDRIKSEFNQDSTKNNVAKKSSLTVDEFG